ncbi:hypothetical protein HAALTHF_05010n [Vreelandella aquamarina]|nr:hypothetical protein HAALTHF_05010n [Halomonas axialensis]
MGGLAEKARLDSRWLIPQPSAFTPYQSMAIGTAGYTAMLAVMALEERGVTPDQGEILVTGASGGVGSYAITLLARLGYRVVASTGRQEEAPYLVELGAENVIDRRELSDPGRPLAKERWAGAIDSVGSHTPCQRAGFHKIWRHRGVLWTRAGDGFTHQRCPIHFTRCHARGYR